MHGRRLPIVEDPGGGATDHPDVLVPGGLQQLRMQTGDVAAEPLHQVAGTTISGRCVSTHVGWLYGHSAGWRSTIHSSDVAPITSAPTDFRNAFYPNGPAASTSQDISQSSVHRR